MSILFHISIIRDNPVQAWNKNLLFIIRRPFMQVRTVAVEGYVQAVAGRPEGGAMQL